MPRVEEQHDFHALCRTQRAAAQATALALELGQLIPNRAVEVNLSYPGNGTTLFYAIAGFDTRSPGDSFFFLILSIALPPCC